MSVSLATTVTGCFLATSNAELTKFLQYQHHHLPALLGIQPTAKTTSGRPRIVICLLHSPEKQTGLWTLAYSHQIPHQENNDLNVSHARGPWWLAHCNNHRKPLWQHLDHHSISSGSWCTTAQCRHMSHLAATSLYAGKTHHRSHRQ